VYGESDGCLVFDRVRSGVESVHALYVIHPTWKLMTRWRVTRLLSGDTPGERFDSSCFRPLRHRWLGRTLRCRRRDGWVL